MSKPQLSALKAKEPSKDLRRKLSGHPTQSYDESLYKPQTPTLSGNDQLWDALCQNLLRHSPDRLILKNLLKILDVFFLQSAVSIHKKNAQSFFLLDDNGVHSSLNAHLRLIRETDPFYPLFTNSTCLKPTTTLQLSKQFPQLATDFEFIDSCSMITVQNDKDTFVVVTWHAETLAEEVEQIERSLVKFYPLFEHILLPQKREFLANEIAARAQAQKTFAFKVLTSLFDSDNDRTV